MKILPLAAVRARRTGWLAKKMPEYVDRIKDNLTNEKIDALIGEYPDDIISPAMKVLLSLFLKERRNKIIEIFERN